MTGYILFIRMLNRIKSESLHSVNISPRPMTYEMLMYRTRGSHEGLHWKHSKWNQVPNYKQTWGWWLDLRIDYTHKCDIFTLMLLLHLDRSMQRFNLIVKSISFFVKMNPTTCAPACKWTEMGTYAMDVMLSFVSIINDVKSSDEYKRLSACQTTSCLCMADGFLLLRLLNDGNLLIAVF